jgi:hypothetical protein
VGHSRVYQGLARLDLIFVVFAQPVQPAPPGEGPLNDPAVRLRIPALDHLQRPAHPLAQVLHELPAVAGVGPDEGKTRQVGAVEVHGLSDEGRAPSRSRELAATGGQGGGPVLALVMLQLLADPRSGGGGTSWDGSAGNLPLGRTCPDATNGYWPLAPGIGPAGAPIPWSEEWVARDGTWGFAARFSAPLDGPPQGGTLAGVKFAVATRTSHGQPLVVVGDADQATVEALADNPPSG